MCGGCSSPTSSSTTPIAVSATTIAFPVTAVGATATSSVTVSTTSNAVIGVSVNDTADFQISTTCTVSLPAGASCPVNVQFRPVVPGTMSAWLTISSSTGNTVVALSGTATGVPPGGGVVSPVSLLQIVTTQPNPFYLAPRQTSQLAASATLTGGGVQDVTAVVAWSSSDPTVATVSPAGLITAIGGGTASISVAYQGHAASIRVLVVGAFTIAPGSLTFPTTAVGQQAAVQTLTVTLRGPNIIGSVSSSNSAEFTVLSNTCDMTAEHAAGYACTVGIQFSPIAAGPRTAQIAVTSAAPVTGPAATLMVTGLGQ